MWSRISIAGRLDVLGFASFQVLRAFNEASFSLRAFSSIESLQPSLCLLPFLVGSFEPSSSVSGLLVGNFCV